MSDPIDDALSTIWGHPGPWSEEMRGRMAQVINATLERAETSIDGIDIQNDAVDLGYELGALLVKAHAVVRVRALKLAIPESNSTNAGEG